MRILSMADDKTKEDHMKKVIYMIFILTGIMATTMAMTGCANPVKEENLHLSAEVSKVNQENEMLKEEIKQLQQNNQELDEQIAKLDPERAQKGSDVVEQKQGESVFNIYGGDIDTYEKQVIQEVKIQENLSLEEKLTLLAQELSKVHFKDLVIALNTIQEQDGKKIAVINLVENENETGASWIEDYFQGSAGGITTTVALEETFLQRDYQGDWIDGVNFLYEMEPIRFDHVESLGETIYR